MARENATSPSRHVAAGGELVTMKVAGQWLGVPVTVVQDVLGPQRLTRVPRADSRIAGVLNLRGRIVTAIDLRARLGAGAATDREPGMSVVVEHEGELYSLLIDQIGDVLSPPADRYERDVDVLSPAWRQFASGLYRMDEQLLVALDIARILNFEHA